MRLINCFVTMAVTASAALPMTAAAQAWPSKPIRMLIPYPAGGTSDILARLIGPKMTEAWDRKSLSTIASAPVATSRWISPRARLRTATPWC
jgi:tripartite-type tricarboxylate transporter receptor subunit TctC